MKLWPPNWVFRTMFARTPGRRYKKLVKYVEPWVPPAYPARVTPEVQSCWDESGRWVGRRMVHTPASGAGMKENPRGYLPFAEYRFWTGSRYEAGAAFCQCRVCGCNGHSKEFRAEHFRNNPLCAKLTVKALKSVVKTQECIVCGKHTRRKKWGALLCSEQCQQDWMFNWFSQHRARFNAAVSGVKATLGER